MSTKNISEILNKLIVKRSSYAQTESEFAILANVIERSNTIPGAFAEIGVFEGLTSEFIFMFKNKEKKFFICDTFQGLVDVSEKDISNQNTCLSNGFAKNSYENFCAVNTFIQFKDVVVVNGYFPGSATPEMDQSKYAFVHLDVDTYSSTLNSLKYFYDKMHPGGSIVVHDYINNPETLGVRRALDEFMAGKNDEISTNPNSTQAIIIKN